MPTSSANNWTAPRAADGQPHAERHAAERHSGQQRFPRAPPSRRTAWPRACRLRRHRCWLAGFAPRGSLRLDRRVVSSMVRRCFEWQRRSMAGLVPREQFQPRPLGGPAYGQARRRGGRGAGWPVSRCAAVPLESPGCLFGGQALFRVAAMVDGRFRSARPACGWPAEAPRDWHGAPSTSDGRVPRAGRRGVSCGALSRRACSCPAYRASCWGNCPCWSRCCRSPRRCRSCPCPCPVCRGPCRRRS